jgi:ABC-type dipeptide/oligopeptide/nickel transport system ATPase component
VVRDLSVGITRGNERQPVLHSISFAIAPGEIVGLVGESGSGKTVTALTLMRLLDPALEISSGTCELRGVDLLGLDDTAMSSIRGKRIGLVSQEPMVALDPLFPIGAQLEEVLRLHHRESRRALRARAMKLLTDVRLPDPQSVMARHPYELSGGMIQRVVIAMALAGDPELLIADEPTTALDVTVQAGILELLRDLRTRRGMSILFVTHDLGVVADVCDRAIVMSEGRIVEEAMVDDLFYNPQAEYTKRLISNTPSLLEEQR